MAPDVVVGAGHNGLITACYLARAGRDVVVLEALDQPGGGSRTAETIPGFRFDLHSVAHNIINMTDIPDELDLAGAGLDYRQMDPFSISIGEDGRHIRFFRSVDRTLESIAAISPQDVDAYRAFVHTGEKLLRAALPAIRGGINKSQLPRRVLDLIGAVLPRPLATARDVLSPYGSLLRRTFDTEAVRAPIAAFAAHAGVGPSESAGAFFAYWQAAYHRFGQWHAIGGAQSLTDALVARLKSLGGEVRCSTRVSHIDGRGGRIRRVVTEAGEQIAARTVTTALDPKRALLELVSPALGGPEGRTLGAAHRGNAVQAVVHIATDRLPPYRGAGPGDWSGLQSLVSSVDELEHAWTAASAGHVTDALPLYAFTTSAEDATLAPPDHHTVYLACPAAPAIAHGGWSAHREQFVAAALARMERAAPSFSDSIQGVAVRTPDVMIDEDGWPGAHPMHLDVSLDQLGPLRPTRRLAGHRTPVTGLYVTGAGTNPTGGIAGTPGRLAARAILADATRRRR